METWATYFVVIRPAGKSRRLIAETIDRAWRDYLASLPGSHPGRILCENQLISILAERNGFRSFDDLLPSIVKENDRQSPAWIRSKNGVISSADKASLKQINSEFKATLSTLRELTSRCQGKKPKKIKIGKLNAQRLRPKCELCGDPTELAEVLTENAQWPSEDPDKRASLSGRYCIRHRVKHHDGTWNANYQRAKRSKEEFEQEVWKIEHHTCDVDDIGIAREKERGDPFLWTLTRQLDVFLDEDERIRNLARQLIDSRVTTRKRQIITLLAAGVHQSEIGRRLGVSRQAISKVVRSEKFQDVVVKFSLGTESSHSALSSEGG
jgi:transposase-like protein